MNTATQLTSRKKIRGGESMRKHKQGLSLSVKIYLLIIVIIVTVSAALVFTGYNTFCQNVDEAYHNRTKNAVSAGSEFSAPLS